MSAPLQSAAVLAVINRTERAARHERLNERRAERERSPVTWFVSRKTAETLEGAAATLSALLAERDALRHDLTIARMDAQRARAEEREACAAAVDCGCAGRTAVLDRLHHAGEKRASYLCTRGDACCALLAAAIRARGEAGR